MKNSTTLIDICIVLCVVLILFAGPVVGAVKCRSQATAMQLNYTWGPVQGCMIETKPGRWVPLSNYREVQ